MKEGDPDRPTIAAPDPLGVDDERAADTEAGSGNERPVERVGERLRAAREALGLSLAEVGGRTRVPLRQLEAIEVSDFAGLPSPTYAVGFARAYARAVGLDEVAVARDVRGELAKVDRPPEYVPYETADPDRVPSRGVAIVGLGLAIALLVLAGLWYGTDLFRGGDAGPGMVAQVPVAAPPATGVVPAPTPAAPRQVTLTAGAAEVWMRVYDAKNATLYLGTLAPGAKFDVPPGADGPMINVGRPDQLQVTLDGRPVPPLGDGRRAIKDVPVDAAAIGARLAGGAAPTPTPTSTSTGASPGAASGGARRTSAAVPSRALTETQRANLQSAANLPPVRRRDR